MPKKKKEEKPVEHQNIFVEINDAESLRLGLQKCSNPMEKMMAINLFEYKIRFYPQYKIDCPDGWTISGRKYFIADFYIPFLNLVIETDGKIHNEEENIVKDIWKDNTLNCLGYHVFRFNWDTVIGYKDSDKSLTWIDFLLELKENLTMERDALECSLLKEIEAKQSMKGTK